MTTDSELLRQYAENHDETAFAKIAGRYVNLVYATALRQLNGDTHLAQDAAQAVFTDMGRNAEALIGHATLAGWLHTSARFHASKIARTEHRRHEREQKVFAMSNQTTTTEISWEHLAPLLDEALGQLGEADRDALLLRFFQDKSHKEVGAILGLDENTARMRVTRVLEKLRDYFARYGVTTTAALLASTLGSQAASVSAPPIFAASLARKSLAGVAKTAAMAASTTGWSAKKSLVIATVMIFATGFSLSIYTRFSHSAPLAHEPLKVVARARPTPVSGKMSAASPDPDASIDDISTTASEVSTAQSAPATDGKDVVPDALLTKQSLADAERHTFDIANLGHFVASIVRINNRTTSNQYSYVAVQMHVWSGYTPSGPVNLYEMGLMISRFSPEDQVYIKKWAQKYALENGTEPIAPDVKAELDRLDGITQPPVTPSDLPGN